MDELLALAARFHGEMEQTPPVYSAKKIGGCRRISCAGGQAG